MAAPWPPLGASSLGDWGAFLVGRRSLVAVVGRSMEPTLAPGDRVWIDRRAYGDRDPEPGEIVLMRRPDRPEQVLIKRAIAPSASGAWIVLGDNAAASTDSRHFGPVPRSHLLGRVVSRL
jgi:nickel-type superoxide dismutase maturation protease